MSIRTGNMGAGGGGGGGTVSSPGMTPTHLPVATGPQVIADSPLEYTSGNNDFSFRANRVSINVAGATNAKAFLERLAIAPGATEDALLVYQTNLVKGFYYWNGTTAAWVLIGTGAGNVTTALTFTAGKIPVATTGTNLENSIMTQAGFVISILGNLTVSSLITTHKLVTAGLTPGIVAGVGAGAAPVLAIVGNDMSGVITLQIGAGGGALGSILTVTYNIPYTAIPKVYITPISDFAANATDRTGIYGAFPCVSAATNTVNGFDIVASNVTGQGLQAGFYSWNYFVVQ